LFVNQQWFASKLVQWLNEQFVTKTWPNNPGPVQNSALIDSTARAEKKKGGGKNA